MSATLRYSFANGAVIEKTATAAITAGDVVVVGTLAGVAALTGSTGDVIPIELSNAHEVTKPTGVAFAQGAAVYSTSSGVLTATATGNVYLGAAYAAATSGAGLNKVTVGLRGYSANSLS